MRKRKVESELLEALLSRIPLIIDHHADDMVSLGGECEQYYKENDCMLRELHTNHVNRIVHAIFLESEQFENFKEEFASVSFEKGRVDAVSGNIIKTVVLESNHNIRLQLFNYLLPAMDTVVDDSWQKCFYASRMNDIASLRFKSYFQGYVSGKEQQIDVLHQQKISIMGQMAAGMAHEIRNPLASIMGFHQFMKEQVAEDRIEVYEFFKYLDICLHELSSIEKLVSNFLILARKNEMVKKELVPVELMSILRRVNELAKYFVLEKNIPVFYFSSEEEYWVSGIASYIEQVCLNIIKNGIDSIDETGTFEVRIRQDKNKNQVVILFVDSGTGISEEKLRNIFEPFYTTQNTGTGIGLSICKQLLLEMGGSIHVASTVGIGTTVEVRLVLFGLEKK